MTSESTSPSNRRPLRAIFFDVDDTLFSTSEFAQLARHRAIDAMIRYGLRMSRTDAYRELDEVIKEFSSNYEFHYDKLLRRIDPALYAGVNPAILIAAGVIHYHQTKIKQLRVFPDVLRVLRHLSKSPVLLGIITAGLTIKQAEKILRLRIYQYLEPKAIFISDQIGISKPNVKLYQRACESVRVRPEEAMYVGDNAPNDVDPPNRLGMITVHSRREGSKYAKETGTSRPDYTITTFDELQTILERDFELMQSRST
ncbi:MAG: TIGR02253 family HAD-type hydrolase [Planctomycetota bacterium]